jgi:hypothetical protein
MLEEIGRAQELPTKIFEDNAACIHSSNETKAFGPRSKHIDVCMFKLREFVQDKILVLEKVHTAGNVANCLTKALPKDVVETMRTVMLGAQSRERKDSAK